MIKYHAKALAIKVIAANKSLGLAPKIFSKSSLKFFINVHLKVSQRKI